MGKNTQTRCQAAARASGLYFVIGKRQEIAKLLIIQPFKGLDYCSQLIWAWKTGTTGTSSIWPRTGRGAPGDRAPPSG
jgi:hypothetical protein